MSQNEHLERMCKQLTDSLVAGSRGTLCLNIADKSFVAEDVVRPYLATKGRKDVTFHSAPDAEAFTAILEGLAGIVIVQYDDLDKHPKCLDVLLEHVKKPVTDARLIVVSRDWNSDNTKKELEIRKHCLFYTQALPAKEPRTRT